MNLEQKVTSLELSKKLNELGVKQESLFYWDKPLLRDEYLLVYEETIHSYGNRYSAFTASELLELFPTDYEIKKIKVTYDNGKSYSEYFIKHEDDGIDSSETFYDTNICNALAKMLIHLIEKGSIKP
jgi:hypothetical protein